MKFKNNKRITIKRSIIIWIVITSLIVGNMLSFLPIGFSYKIHDIGNSSYQMKMIEDNIDEELIALFSTGTNAFVIYLQFYASGSDYNLDRLIAMLNEQIRSVGVVLEGEDSKNVLQATHEDIRDLNDMLKVLLEVSYSIKHTMPSVDGKYDKEALYALEEFQLMDKLMRDFYFTSLGDEACEEKGVYFDGQIFAEDRAKYQLENFRSEEFQENTLLPLLQWSSK
ncbi:MAG: hypothetical protein R3Y32_07030 [Bacillota bacterium]